MLLRPHTKKPNKNISLQVNKQGKSTRSKQTREKYAK